MKIFQLFVLIMSIMQLCAMDQNAHQVSTLHIAMTNQIELQSDRILEEERARHASNMQHVLQQLERQARWKCNKNLTNLVMNFEFCKNNVIEMLGGYARPSLVFYLPDRNIVPWIIAKQRDTIVQAVAENDYAGLKKSCGLLDAYTSLFVSPQASKSSGFIKNYKDKYGKTLFHASVYNIWPIYYDRNLYNSGNVPLVKFLLDRGGNIDIPDNHGSTLLHSKVLHGTVALVKFLLARGAKVDIQDNNGFTPLHKACLSDHIELVQLLLNYRADVNIRDVYGRTPDELTMNQEIKDLIRRARRDRGQSVCTIM